MQYSKYNSNLQYVDPADLAEVSIVHGLYKLCRSNIVQYSLVKYYTVDTTELAEVEQFV